MRIVLNTFEYDGSPDEERHELQWHLVSSVAIIKDPLVKIILNFEDGVELIGHSSTHNSIDFIFSKDQEWCGSYETEVTIFGDTPEEIELLKGNQFRQKDKGQIVVAILPWTDPRNDEVIVTWSSDTDK